MVAATLQTPPATALAEALLQDIDVPHAVQRRDDRGLRTDRGGEILDRRIERIAFTPSSTASYGASISPAVTSFGLTVTLPCGLTIWRPLSGAEPRAADAKAEPSQTSFG